MLRYEHRACFDVMFNISACCGLEEGYVYYLLSEAGNVKINEGVGAGHKSLKWSLEGSAAALLQSAKIHMQRVVRDPPYVYML